MNMLHIIAMVMVVGGIGILIASLIPIRQLLIQPPPGQVRGRWYIMTALNVLFIIGYVAYILAYWDRHFTPADLLVPGVFFFGAGYVWLSCMLSLQAVKDVRRVVLLEQESITDPLSGLYNRRYLDRRLEEEMERSKRHEVPLSILLIDIDHFKHINDSFGHPAGDRVVSYLGKLTLNGIRSTDIAARYGGDEYLVIAPNTPPAQAGELAERLRQHIESHALVMTSGRGNRQEVQVTVCIGVAGCQSQTASMEMFLQAADEALYCAKQAGRNRIIIHNPC
jgi:diguanylate cyclase (GGDEF)-like protein